MNQLELEKKKKIAQHKRKWANNNKEKRQESCQKYCETHKAKRKESIKRWNDNNRPKRRETLSKWREQDKRRSIAHSRVNKKLKEKRPDKCYICNKEHDFIHGHHQDYNEPLKVIWCCPVCHKNLHKVA